MLFNSFISFLFVCVLNFWQHVLVMMVTFIYHARNSPRLLNAVFCVYFVLLLFAYSCELAFCVLFSHNKKSERWLQLQDLRLSRREVVGAKEKATWVPCPNNIPAEISPATPRSNTGQQSTAYNLVLGGYLLMLLSLLLFIMRLSRYYLWRTLNISIVFSTCHLHATFSVFVV